MLNLFAFVADMNRHIVFTKGEETLIQAEANPPKPDTPEFAKTINVLEVFISGKKDRQDRAIALLCNQPILATTHVVGAISKMMEDEKADRCISLDRLGNLPAMIANVCKVAIYEDMAVEVPSGRQIGALHNLLNLVDILVTGFQKKRGCVREISDMAFARFGDNLPATFTSRTKWAFENKPAPAQSTLPVHGKTNGHAVDVATPVTNGTLGEKLGAALGIKPEESAEEQADLMSAAMVQLSKIAPEQIDALKNGEVPVDGAPAVPVAEPEMAGATV